MEDHLDMAPFVGGYSASSGGASHLGHYAPSSSSSSSYSSNGNNHNNNSLSQHHHHHQQQQHSYHASSPSASASYLPSSDFVADSLHILSSLSHQQEICNSSISLHNLHSLASSSCSTSSRPLPSSAAAASSSSSSTSSSSSNVGSGSAASSPSSPLFNDPSSPPVQTTTPKKRGRKRKYGDTSDPEELKKQLRARDQEISRLKRRIQQLETLLQQQQSSSAASFANASSSASSSSDASSSSSASLSNHNNSGDVFGIYVNRNPDQVEKEVRNVLLSVKQQVTSQMVYRSSLKHAHSRISAQVPRVSAQAVDVIFQELNPKSKGPKLIKWACSATDLANIFGIYGKSLRYGASLEVVGQSNVTWQREDGDLSIKGKFTMVRG